MIPRTFELLFLAVFALLQSATLCQGSRKIEYLLSSSISGGGGGFDDDDAASVDVHHITPLSRHKRRAVLKGLSVARILAIVNTHNKCRREVDPPASNMQFLEWEDELANIAQCHAQSCQFRHNNFAARQQHSAGVWLAQNLGAVFGEDNFMNVSGMVRGWFNERRSFNFSTSKCKPGDVCGHYTAMAWPITRWVGCGLATCKPFEVTIQNRVTSVGTYLVCNYRPGGNTGIRQNDTLYKTGGGGPCSICHPGQTCDNGLCRTAGCSAKNCSKGIQLLKDVCVCNVSEPFVCPEKGSGTKIHAFYYMIFMASTLFTPLLVWIYF